MSTYDLEIIKGQMSDFNVEDEQIAFDLLDLTQEWKGKVVKGKVVNVSYLYVSIDVSAT